MQAFLAILNTGTIPVLMSLSYQFCRHHKCGITDSLAFQLVKLCRFHVLPSYVCVRESLFVPGQRKATIELILHESPFVYVYT